MLVDAAKHTSATVRHICNFSYRPRFNLVGVSRLMLLLTHSFSMPEVLDNFRNEARWTGDGVSAKSAEKLLIFRV